MTKLSIWFFCLDCSDATQIQSSCKCGDQVCASGTYCYGDQCQDEPCIAIDDNSQVNLPVSLKKKDAWLPNHTCKGLGYLGFCDRAEYGEQTQKRCPLTCGKCTNSDACFFVFNFCIHPKSF